MGAEKQQARLAACASVALFFLAACSSSQDSGSTASGAGEDDVAIAYVKRPAATLGNPTDAIMFSAGGDLYIRERSSPSASERNITRVETNGQGDVSDPDVSYDGDRIIFSMRRNASERWRIWEYDRTTGELRQIPCQATDLNGSPINGDDVDPAYLPDGGIVFASNRQVGTWRAMQARGETPYRYLDEYEREPVTALHVMDGNGQNCQQISFNQSHDRNPTVRPDGKIMFSRWDHVGDRNHFSIFQVNPDGTDMFILYGAHSPGNSFLHPQQMLDGRVMSSLMPLSGTDEGGALMLIDVDNYTENDTPMRRGLPTSGGQQQATASPITLGRELSFNGRITTPFPLWDGTPRALVAFSPCQVRKDGQIVPCAVLTPEERARISDDERLLADIQADPVQTDVPAAYSIHMLNYATQEMRLVVPAEVGMAVTDPIALMPRRLPNPRGRSMPTGPTGTVEVLSVYDTDQLGRMGPGSGGSLLLATELADLPTTPPVDPTDTRNQVVDLLRIKNPLDPSYSNRVARFIRVTTPMAPPSGSQGLRQAIGETEFEMQRILGYAEVEPDGSFMLTLPSDLPFAFSVLDAKGRALQTHTNWMQVRPGERLSCKGCHTPRPTFQPIADMARGSHNAAQWLMNANPATETMALTRARVNGGTPPVPAADISFSDVWANTAVPGVTPTPSVTFNYTTGTGGSGADGVPVVPVNGIINYPEHIQPIWERARTCPGGGDCTCVSCHTDTTRLSLLNTTTGTGRLQSYEELLVGDPLLDSNGQPVIRIVEGVPEVQRGAALVSNTASQGDAGGIARKSRLTEILSGEDLRASADAGTRFPTPTAPDHTALLNTSEMRLLTEWMDLGGQYYNTPFNNGIVRTVSTVDEDEFSNVVHPILMTRCASCHQPVGSGTGTPPSFQGNRFVLTGSAEGDFNATLALVNDACAPANSLLLSRPSEPHPTTSATPTVVLPAGDDYTAIANWIQDGC